SVSTSHCWRGSKHLATNDTLSAVATPMPMPPEIAKPPLRPKTLVLPIIAPMTGEVMCVQTVELPSALAAVFTTWLFASLSVFVHVVVDSGDGKKGFERVASKLSKPK